MISVRIETDPSLLRFAVDGFFDIHEFRSTMSEVLSHPDYRPGIPSLWVMGRGSVSRVSHSDVAAVAREIVDLSARRGRGASWKVAVVVNSQVDLGMSRMLQILAGDGPATMKVFRDEALARAWALDQDAP